LKEIGLKVLLKEEEEEVVEGANLKVGENKV
jgi:hypothetical protein